MNQILNSKEIKATDNYIYSSSPDKKFNFYKLIFFLCILFTIIFFIFFITFLINIKSKENHAKDLANTFTLTSLYSISASAKAVSLLGDQYTGFKPLKIKPF